MRSVTVGSGFFADIAASWEDAGKGGQLAFPGNSRAAPGADHVQRSGYGLHLEATPKRLDHLAVQAGTPCVDGTRVPTSLLADLVDTGKSIVTHVIAQLCDTYRLTREHVREAIAYEVSLAA